MRTFASTCLLAVGLMLPSLARAESIVIAPYAVETVTVLGDRLLGFSVGYHADGLAEYNIPFTPNGSITAASITYQVSNAELLLTALDAKHTFAPVGFAAEYTWADLTADQTIGFGSSPATIPPTFITFSLSSDFVAKLNTLRGQQAAIAFSDSSYFSGPPAVLPTLNLTTTPLPPALACGLALMAVIVFWRRVFGSRSMTA